MAKQWTLTIWIINKYYTNILIGNNSYYSFQLQNLLTVKPVLIVDKILDKFLRKENLEKKKHM